MPCKHITPAKGHQRPKKCNNPESKGGFCTEHQPPPVIVTATPVTLSWHPKPESKNNVNANFQSACDDESDLIEGQCQNGIQSGGMPFKGKGNKGPHSLLHYTQPRANNTIFYQWVGNSMEIYGVGSHSGNTNKKYSLLWFDGSNATVDLSKKKIV